MAEPYLQELRSIVGRAAPAAGSAVECRHFFSGAAAYVDGKIFMSLTPAGLALKLPAGARGQLTEAGAKPLRYFPKGPVKKEYVILPETITRDDDALAPWIEQSIRFALSAGKECK